MKNNSSIENNTTIQLGQAYEEESENLEAQWRSVHLKMLVTLSLVAVITELIFIFLLNKGELISIPEKTYIIKYLFIPMISYALLDISVCLIYRYLYMSDKAMNYVISIGFAVFCLMMCFFHSYFVVVYACGLMAISLTTIYGDQLLTGVTTIIIIVAELALSLFGGWDPDVMVDETYMIDVSLIMLIELGDYLICNSIVAWEDRRRHAVIMRQYEIEDLRRTAVYDQLTKVKNRQGLRLFIDGNPQKPMYVMMDIDYFKSVNDRWGHNTGDIILAGLGKILLSKENNNVAAFRYGGDEFLLIFIGTDRDDITKICEDIRKEFLAMLTDEMREKKIGISYGIAPGEKYSTPSEAIRSADEELYKSKSRR